MFGQNPIRAIENRDSGLVLWIQEVFGTLQGEGPFAGMSSVFVRLAGCNLRCHFCDTDFESSSWKPSLHELMEKIGDERQCVVPNSDLIVLTGGEPLRQNVFPLISECLQKGWKVQIETAGSVMSSDMFHLCDQALDVHIVCSPKTGKVVDRISSLCRHWKYIISADDERDAEDGLPIASTQVKGAKQRLFRPPPGRRDTIWVQAMDQYDAAKNDANLKLCAELVMRHGYRLSVQMHKLAGVK